MWTACSAAWNRSFASPLLQGLATVHETLGRWLMRSGCLMCGVQRADMHCTAHNTPNMLRSGCVVPNIQHIANRNRWQTSWQPGETVLKLETQDEHSNQNTETDSGRVLCCSAVAALTHWQLYALVLHHCGAAKLTRPRAGCGSILLGPRAWEMCLVPLLPQQRGSSTSRLVHHVQTMLGLAHRGVQTVRRAGCL